MQSEYVLRCTQLWGWGWSSDDPTCATMAAKFTKRLEFRGVSRRSLAPNKSQAALSTCVEVGGSTMFLGFISLSCLLYTQQTIVSFLEMMTNNQRCPVYSAITNTTHTFHGCGLFAKPVVESRTLPALFFGCWSENEQTTFDPFKRTEEDQNQANPNQPEPTSCLKKKPIECCTY